jgi:hypothetical protein
MLCSGEITSVCGGTDALTLLYDASILDSSLNLLPSVTASISAAVASATAALQLPRDWKLACSSGIMVAEGTTGRALTGASTSSSDMTPKVCTAYCSSLGFALSGVEWSSEW